MDIADIIETQAKIVANAQELALSEIAAGQTTRETSLALGIYADKLMTLILHAERQGNG